MNLRIIFQRKYLPLNSREKLKLKLFLPLKLGVPLLHLLKPPLIDAPFLCNIAKDISLIMLVVSYLHLNAGA